MKMRVIFGIAAVGLVLATGCQSAQKGASAAKATLNSMENQEFVVKQARDMVYPATVRVEAHKTDYFAGQKKRTGGTGSGVSFDSQGHILTNYHVAGRADELSCTLFNKEHVKAKLVGADPWTDLAVIQLDMNEIREKGISFDWAPLGDSSLMSEGDAVLAIGSPFGLSRSISQGIISCSDRILGEAMDLGGGLETGLFNTWLQTDAAINPGNSGGPLVNLQGEVIGINTRGGGNELGFAVPINVAKKVVLEILHNGKVTRSDIGLKFQPLQDFEGFFEVGKTEGAVIASVEPDGAAAAAGVMPQDILLEYNGHKVLGRYPEELFELRRMIAEDTPVGSPVTLKIRRGGNVKPFTVTTTELTTVRGDEANFEKWGFVGQDVTSRLAERENLKERKGVFITGVRSGEPAEKVQIAEDDLILSVGDKDGVKDVANVAELKKLYDASVAKKQERVLLRVRRGLATMPKVLTVTYSKDEAPADAVKPETKKSDKDKKTPDEKKTDEKESKAAPQEK